MYIIQTEDKHKFIVRFNKKEYYHDILNFLFDNGGKISINSWSVNNGGFADVGPKRITCATSFIEIYDDNLLVLFKLKYKSDQRAVVGSSQTADCCSQNGSYRSAPRNVIASFTVRKQMLVNHLHDLKEDAIIRSVFAQIPPRVE